MKQITLTINPKIFKMMEEITKHHNDEIGISISLEETLEDLIYAHFITEVAVHRKHTAEIK
ncbi:hypothetical protein RJD24_14595 [Bacillaceae bacterium IKA-2]|nr:hypothetical protein RJD24_14595 [Bacillaceae bacterium IKA-2]